VLGREDLLGDARMADSKSREQHEAEINAMVSDWSSRHDKHTAMQLLGAAGIPAGAVLDTKELAEDASFAQRGILQTVEHTDGREFRMPAWPVRHNGTTAAVKPAPALGQHTGEVLEAWLGLSPREIAGLEQDKVIQQHQASRKA
jgi:crotonobetainyl-CoA:carnitine CoA-transferase CaiB-like acyl-CoA transferase